MGRWVTRDPIGEGAGLNLYEFVRNDPICLRDPHGLFIAGCCQRKEPREECCCVSITVTFSPGGDRFGGLDLDVAKGRYGNDIHVLHKVQGSPRLCTYLHIEDGTYVWVSPSRSGVGSGRTSDATTATDVKWTSDSFEYTDYLGFSPLIAPPPLTPGVYLMEFENFTMRMTCTGTDGRTVSSEEYKIEGRHVEVVLSTDGVDDGEGGDAGPGE
jgi:hypothetical protein